MCDTYKKLKVPYLEYSHSIDKMLDFILQDRNTSVVMMQTSSSFVVTGDTAVCHKDMIILGLWWFSQLFIFHGNLKLHMSYCYMISTIFCNYFGKWREITPESHGTRQMSWYLYGFR